MMPEAMAAHEYVARGEMRPVKVNGTATHADSAHVDSAATHAYSAAVTGICLAERDREDRRHSRQ